MLRVVACITDQHDLRFVVLAGVICCLACYTAMSLLSRSDRGQRRRALGWLIAAALVTGSGVWSTHFVARLGFQPSLPNGFELGLTALSILIAVVASRIDYTLAFFHWPGRRSAGRCSAPRSARCTSSGWQATRCRQR